MNANREDPADRFNPAIQPPREFRELFAAEILPRLPIDGRKVLLKRRMACKIAYSLVVSGLNGKPVGDPRNSRNEFRRRLWDMFIEAELCSKATGSEMGHVVTRYRAKAELLALRELWTRRELDAEHQDGPGLIIVKDRDTGKPQPIADFDRDNPITNAPEIDALIQSLTPAELVDWMASNLTPAAFMRSFLDNPEHWKRQAEGLDAINRVNLSHSWVAEREEIGGDGRTQRVAFQPAVTLRLTYRGQPFEHGRFYTYGPGGAQSMKREHRRTLRIDGQPTAELDFAGYHLSMLYHARAEMDPPSPDPYAPERVFPWFWSFRNASPGRRKALRGLLKQFIGVAFNKVRGLSQAVGAGRNLIKDADPAVQDVVWRTEKAGASELFRRIEEAHAPIARFFYRDIGPCLMLFDSLLMNWILTALTTDRPPFGAVPVLCLHDGLLVREDDEHWAWGIMTAAYQHMFGFSPTIRTKT